MKIQKYFTPRLTKEQYENARKWIAALKSGTFKQGKNYLSYNGAYCCLGVACEIFSEQYNLVKTKVTSCTKYSSGNEDDIASGNEGDIAILIPTIANAIGLATLNGTPIETLHGKVDKKTHLPCLAEDNDRGKTFVEIANLLSTHLDIYKEKDGEYVEEENSSK